MLATFLKIVAERLIARQNEIKLILNLLNFNFWGFFVMAVTIAELIEKRDELKNKRKELYDLETSIGTITVKQPTFKMIDDNLKIKGRQGDVELIFDCVVEPNLKDKDLQSAYGCVQPSDIVKMLFKTGEIGSIASAIMSNAGFGKSIESKIHEEIKN